MKILTRNTVFFLLTAITLLLIATCIEPDEPSGKIDDDDDITYGHVHFDTLDVKGQQVWMPNKSTGKVSQMLLRFTGDRTVDVIVIEPLAVPPYHNYHSVGEGEIKKGILSFSVDEDEIESNLLDGEDLLKYYFNEWYVDVDSDSNIDITIMPPSAKGNIITLVSLYDSDTEPVEGIIREGFSGTNDSLTGQYIYYLYVDTDCTISAEKVEITELKYTFNEFELTLKAGWNTILKSETYTTTGDSSYSIKVLNPSIRWIMQKTK